VALIAVEAFFVPHCALGEHLFSSKDGTATAWTSLSIGRLDCRCVKDDEWTIGCDIFFTKVFNKFLLLEKITKKKFFFFFKFKKSKFLTKKAKKKKF
jgi:hypothetical protein